MVATYNALIAYHASNFQASNRGSTVQVFDTHAFLTTVLDDPSPFGIKNTTGYCSHYDAPDIATNFASYGCLPIHEYFWYNTGHITYRIHEILAAELERWLN